MKFNAVWFVLAGALCAQTQAPIGPPPGAAAPGAKDVSDTTVVAIVDGKKLTPPDVKKLLAGATPQVVQAYRSDPVNVVKFLILMRHLTELAEKDKLDQQAPYKEELAFLRMNTLAQAEINYHRAAIPVTPDEVRKYYEENKSRYIQPEIKVIYVSYSLPADAASKKGRTEEQARERAAGLHKRAAAGEDFSKLARENSDDKDSAEKGGDFKVSPSAYPEPVRKAVLALQPGGVSEPLKLSNGFYIFKLVSRKDRPFAEVESEVFETLKQERFNTWFNGLQKRFEPKVETPAFFSAKPSGAPAH